jgi:hypothetical protein
VEALPESAGAAVTLASGFSARTVVVVAGTFPPRALKVRPPLVFVGLSLRVLIFFPVELKRLEID